MNSRTYYYARVSSKEQNLDRQILAFQDLGALDREIIVDQESGKNLDRAGYQALKSTILRPGDTLVIKSLDRLRCALRKHNRRGTNEVRISFILLQTRRFNLGGRFLYQKRRFSDSH